MAMTEYPIGHVKPNETPMEAAKRELFDTVPKNYTYNRDDELRDKNDNVLFCKTW